MYGHLETQPILVDFDGSNVCHPGLVDLISAQLLHLMVLGHDSRFTSVLAGSAHVPDLRDDPGQGHQACHTIPRDTFALITQVIYQYMIT